MRNEKEQREYDVSLAVDIVTLYAPVDENALASGLEHCYGWNSLYAKEIANLAWIKVRG